MLTLARRDNYYAYINLSSSDNSGMLRFVTDELQDAEDAGDRGERTDTPLLRELSEASSLDSGTCPCRMGWY